MLHKRSFGLVCIATAQILRAFLKSVGDVSLEKITTQQAQCFLDASDASVGTWRIKHSILKRFFEHWSWRGEMPFLMLPPMKPAVRQTFIPYIYTRPQIRCLLAATRSSQRRRICKADAATLRMFILMLYATGAKYCEVLNIRREDIAFKHSRLTLRGTGRRPPRSIPIGQDLKRELQAYLNSDQHARRRGELVFLGKSREPLYRENLQTAFSASEKSPASRAKRARPIPRDCRI
jgi:integrase/recombinase XerD